MTEEEWEMYEEAEKQRLAQEEAARQQEVLDKAAFQLALAKRVEEQDFGLQKIREEEEERKKATSVASGDVPDAAFGFDSTEPTNALAEQKSTEQDSHSKDSLVQAKSISSVLHVAPIVRVKRKDEVQEDEKSQKKKHKKDKKKEKKKEKETASSSTASNQPSSSLSLLSNYASDSDSN